MTRHLHIDLRPPVDYVLDATADESECTEEINPGRVVKAFCLAVAVGAAVFFVLQLIRSAF